MPKKRVAPVEASEASSPSTSRPARARNAPERLNLSSFNARHQRSSSGRASTEELNRQKQRKWAERLQECDNEEEYIRNYSYAHVGQALRGASPDCWVDVPLLESEVERVSISEAVLDYASSFSFKLCSLKSSADVENLPKGVQAANSLARSLEAKTEKEDAMIILQPEVQGQVEEDASPTQDEHIKPGSSPIEEDELEESDDGFYQIEIHPPVSSPIEDDAAVEVPSIIHTQERTRDAHMQSIDDDASLSPASLAFVDALMEEEEVERNVSGNTTRVSVPVYHIEKRLSHSLDEDHRASSASHQRGISSASRNKDNGVTGRSLFLGSDDEEDHNTRRDPVRHIDQQSDKSGPSRAQVKSTLEQANRSKSSADKGKQKEVAPVQQKEKAYPKGGEKQGNGKQKSAKASHREPSEESRTKKKAISVQEAYKESKASKKRNKRAEKEDLVQNLNVDAYAHSTSNRKENEKRAKNLKKLQKAKQKAQRKRQGEIVSSSESSSSDDSDVSDSDNDSEDQVDFIVDDDDDEPSSSTRTLPPKGAKRIPMPHRRSLSPPTLVSRDLLSDVRSMPRRQRLEDYIRWVIAYSLDWPVSSHLEAVRTNLREKFKADYSSLTTQQNKRQFTWYLKHYPFSERRPMTREEKEEHVGCAACGRKTQKCESVVSFWGKIYKLETLMKTSDYSSSDMSTDGEDWKSKDKSKTLFYVGETCGKYASVKHKLFHWERRVLGDIVKLPLYITLDRKQERISARRNTDDDTEDDSEDDSDDDIEDDVEAIVAFYYPTLSRMTARLESDARTLLTDPSRYTRLRDRFDEEY